jgi:hypothetical protein
VNVGISLDAIRNLFGNVDGLDGSINIDLPNSATTVTNNLNLDFVVDGLDGSIIIDGLFLIKYIVVIIIYSHIELYSIKQNSHLLYATKSEFSFYWLAKIGAKVRLILYKYIRKLCYTQMKSKLLTDCGHCLGFSYQVFVK